MGIKNLIKIINRFAPSAITYTNISKYSHKKIGIDANLLIYKLIFAIRLNGYDLKNGNIIITHIYQLLQKLISFKILKIKPVFVFDGHMPEIKSKTMETRKKTQLYYQKKYGFLKLDITPQEFQDCRQLIQIFGYPILDSPEESDSQLAYLYQAKYIDYIISDDMDILIFGAGKLLKNFSININKKIQEINLKILLFELNFSQNQLVDLAILLGCDYCPSIPTIGPIKAYNLISKYKSLENIISQENIQINFDYQKIRNYFLNPKITKNIKITQNKININLLTKFLEKFKFKPDFITKKIDLISN